MKIILPQNVTETEIVSTNIDFSDYPEWSAGAYNAGDEVRVGEFAYRALENTSDDPLEGVDKDPPTWERLGYVNRYRAFREGSDSRTINDGDIVYTLQFSTTITAVSLHGLAGSDATVKMTDTDAGVVYDTTKVITDFTVGNIWDFYFSPYSEKRTLVFDDLPPFLGADIEITITPVSGSDAEVGRIVPGYLQSLDVEVEHGTSFVLTDLSRKTRDPLGNLILEPLRSIRVVDYFITVPRESVDALQVLVSERASTPMTFIGGVYDSVTIFGIVDDFREVISGPVVSDCVMRVEGF